MLATSEAHRDAKPTSDLRQLARPVATPRVDSSTEPRFDSLVAYETLKPGLAAKGFQGLRDALKGTLKSRTSFAGSDQAVGVGTTWREQLRERYRRFLGKDDERDDLTLAADSEEKPGDAFRASTAVKEDETSLEEEVLQPPVGFRTVTRVLSLLGSVMDVLWPNSVAVSPRSKL